MADEVIYPIMIPIMSSMMLFFIKVEKNRMIPITSMEPMNAPIMTDRNPDKVNTPAVIVHQERTDSGLCPFLLIMVKHPCHLQPLSLSIYLINGLIYLLRNLCQEIFIPIWRINLIKRINSINMICAIYCRLLFQIHFLNDVEQRVHWFYKMTAIF